MPLATHGLVPAHRLEELSRFVASHRTTEGILRAIEAAGLELAEILEMDEYTLDIVVPLPDGLALVYDTT
jgi:hypothetical protein